jgi:hypothetical protein
MSDLRALAERALTGGPRCPDCGEHVAPYAFVLRHYTDDDGRVQRRTYVYHCRLGHIWEERHFHDPWYEYHEAAKPQVVIGFIDRIAALEEALRCRQVEYDICHAALMDMVALAERYRSVLASQNTAFRRTTDDSEREKAT